MSPPVIRVMATTPALGPVAAPCRLVHGCCRTGLVEWSAMGSFLGEAPVVVARRSTPFAIVHPGAASP